MTRTTLIVPLMLGLIAALPAQGGEAKKQEKDPLHHGVEVPQGAVGVIDGMPVLHRAFCDEMGRVFTRPTEPAGLKVVEALVDEYLITREMNRQGISVAEKEVDAEIEKLNGLQKKQSGKSLREVLKENGVPYEVFWRKMRRIVALDRLARGRLKVPAGQPVTNMHRKAWLRTARQAAKIIIPPAKLPEGSVASVDGHRISTVDFTKEILVTLEKAKVAGVIEDLLQERLILKMLALRGLELTEADLLTEWNYRKERFRRNPKFKGIPYDEIVKQQTGLDSQTVRSSLGFRVNSCIGIMARNWFSPKQLEAAYEKHRDRYGPRLTVSHILIEASDNELRQKTGVPTLAQGRERAEYVLGEMEKGTRFAELARIWSKCRATRLKGGRLPEFTPGLSNYETPIVDAAVKMEVGEVSRPVKTNSGWHILKLLAREPAPPLSDKDVEHDLRRFLARQAFTKAYRDAKVGVHLRRPEAQ